MKCGCAAGVLQLRCRLRVTGYGLGDVGVVALWHSRFKRGIYEADDFVSCLPTAKAVGYASTAPTGLNRRHIASHIHKRESVRLLAAGLGVIAAVAAGYEVIWLWVRGCGRYAAVGCGDGITPSCAPLTWGSLECRRFAAFCGCAAGQGL